MGHKRMDLLVEGEGQVGDMQMVRGNRAIRDARPKGESCICSRKRARAFCATWGVPRMRAIT